MRTFIIHNRVLVADTVTEAAKDVNVCDKEMLPCFGVPERITASAVTVTYPSFANVTT